MGQQEEARRKLAQGLLNLSDAEYHMGNSGSRVLKRDSNLEIYPHGGVSRRGWHSPHGQRGRVRGSDLLPRNLVSEDLAWASNFRVMVMVMAMGVAIAIGVTVSGWLRTTCFTPQ